MKIIDIIKNRKPTVSFEFFPPKSTENESILFETIDSLKGKTPDFASVTFGALGTASDKSIEYTAEIKKRLNTTTMMHLTCIGFDNNAIDSILSQVSSGGIKNILALRGDIPIGQEEAVKSRRFTYASDLIRYIKDNYNFCIGAACYPEKHPEAISMNDDIENLKIKIDSGVDFLVTQLFFDNDKFFIFRDKLDKHGINIPIIAGIMPITSSHQIIKFTETCCTSLPQYILDKIVNKSDDEVVKIGIELAVYQSRELMKYGVDGVHYYTLNRSTSTINILNALNR